MKTEPLYHVRYM